MSTTPYIRTESNTTVPLPLRELVHYLEHLESRASIEKLGELLNDLDVDRETLNPFLNFGELTYRRNLIAENDWFELLCICWKSGQRSPIHNHEGSTCGLRIIEGTATETTFETTPCGQIKAVKSEDCEQGFVCTTQDAEIHQVSNLQEPGNDLITLHIYSPPLRMMETYSLLGDVEEYRPRNFMACEHGDGI